MPRVEFQPMIPVFEREKAVHALDRAGPVIGTGFLLYCKLTVYVSIVETTRFRSDHSNTAVLFRKTKLEITFIYSGK
jgi:hypothetical protein